MKLYNQLAPTMYKVIRITAVLSMLSYGNATLTGAKREVVYGNRINIINATPEFFELYLDIGPGGGSWTSGGGIGKRIGNTQQVKPFDFQGGEIYIEPWSKGYIVATSTKEPGEESPFRDSHWREIKAVYYVNENGKKTKKVLDLYHTNTNLFRAIRPKVDEKTGHWKTDEYGNYIYFFEHFDNEEHKYNHYWDKEKGEVVWERKRRGLPLKGYVPETKIAVEDIRAIGQEQQF